VIGNQPGWWIVHVMVNVPRDRPQGHLSTVQPMRWGQLLGLNARWPQGAGGTRIRLTALDGAFANGSRPGGRTLGAVALEADGSFFVQVPVDVPLLLDLLDDDGTLVVEGKTPFWLRPNETRACVGCHEPPGMAPPNRRPLALAHGVKPLTALDEDER
jgi:hypothetical protein